MPDEDRQRAFLVGGTVFLTVFTWAMMAVLAVVGPAKREFVLAGCVFLVAALLLLFNATMLFTLAGGHRGLRWAKALLWASFALILVAIAFLGLAVRHYL